LLEEKIKEGIKVTDYFATPFRGDPLNLKDVQVAGYFLLRFNFLEFLP
jgi:hypothetical protein